MTVAAAGDVELRNITKRFDGGAKAVDDVSLVIRPGELVSLLGPSGCGKTTTLRTVAGFVVPESGQVLIRGVDVTDRPPDKRDVGLLFQSYALFPHMTVEANVAYGLRMRRVPRAERRQRVGQALELVQLGALAGRYPRQLSGGQQQRVALARAIVIRPSVLLLDEPLSNLDAKLRQEMRQEIRALQQRLGITTIFVTHDQEEALTLSDRIAVMNRGRIEQIGAPQDIYRNPATLFVAEFIGEANLLRGTYRPDTERGAWFTGAAGLRIVMGADDRAAADHPVTVSLRPESVIAFAEGDPAATTFANRIPGVVEHRIYLGPSSKLIVRVDPQTRIHVSQQNRDDGADRPLACGDKVVVAWPQSACHVVLAE